MRGIAALSAALVVIAIILVSGRWTSSGPAAKIDDKAAIKGLVDRYYGALREGRYEQAVACYEPGAFDGAGIAPADALKQAVTLSGGVPPDAKLEGLHVTGNRAEGVLTIQRQGVGPISAIAVTQDGKKLGTWARTLVFVKKGREWKLSAKGSNGEERAAKNALQLLRDIQKKQGKSPSVPR